ncbi:MAG: type 1 secretion system ATPase component [Rhodobacteraceae bacterium HLUCCO18]|nr:MAG: type 1 secretion system ATPase component [Rhodobacteraceae bacterium HLUCCO18]
MPENRLALRRPVALAAGFSVFTNLLMLTGPLFMLQIYERVLSSRSQETLLALTMLVSGLYLLYWLLDFARARVMSRVGTRVQAALNRGTFERVLERAALGNGPRGGGLADIEAIRGFYASPLCLALMDAPWTPVFIAAIFIFHPLLGWVGVAGGTVLVTAAILNQVLSARRMRDGGALQAEAQGFARRAEDAGDFIRAQGMTEAVANRWIAMQDVAEARLTRASDWTGAFGAFTRAFRLFLQSAMLAVGAWLVLQGQVTAGAMIAASVMLGRALAPVEVGVSQWPVAQRAWAARRDLKRLTGEMPAAPSPLPLPRPAARLTVVGLSVIASDRERPVLSGISFEIRPGRVLGVIGKSGAGKSSLARAVIGLSRRAAGEVRLDGASIDQFSPDTLGRHIGYLPQTIRILPGTVAENIARMSMKGDPASIVEAAKRARVHDIILTLPKGYDTPLGGSALQLSGGQLQRVALARALFGDPQILILDEPNSALDAEGSEALNTAVLEMKRAGKAVLLMTHRPTAISTCDDILVLEDGRVRTCGPRDEVLKLTLHNAAEVARPLREKRA